MKKYLLIIILVVVLGITSFSFYKTKKEKELPVYTPIASPSKGIPFLFMQNDWRDQDVYLSYIGTNEKILLTTDGPQKEVMNFAPSWVSPHEASFIKCSYRRLSDAKGRCALWIKDIVSNTSKEIFSEPIAVSTRIGADGATIVEMAGGIGAYAWAHDGQSVAYFFFSGGRTRVKLFNRTTKTSREVLVFPEAFGRGGSAADSFRIAFTPDDTHFLVNSTGDDDQNIYIFDRSGNRTNGIAGDFLTFPVWIDNARLFFSSGGKNPGVGMYDITTGRGGGVATNQMWYETRLSPDGKKIVYTMIENDEGKPTVWGKTSVWVYDIASQKSNLVVASADNPRWLSSNDLFVIKMKRCLPGKCEMSDYDFDGYVKITLRGIASPLSLENFPSVATDSEMGMGGSTMFWEEKK